MVRAGGFEPPVSRFVAGYPDPLNDARVKKSASCRAQRAPLTRLLFAAHIAHSVRSVWLGGADSNCRSRLQRPASWPLNDLPVSGVTGENRTLVERSTVARLSHSATVTLGARSTSRTCSAHWTRSAFQTTALTATASLAKLVEEEGVEPSDRGRSRTGRLVRG
jgi:hypothetical protein